MNEITVETTGTFMLVDPQTGHEILPGAPVTVPQSAFITERLENGDLREAEAAPAPKAKSKDDGKK